jgi:hypothetical protein
MVTKALLKYSEYETISHACFRALVVLLMNNAPYKSKLGALGVCSCVVESMHLFPYSAQVSEHMCCLLFVVLYICLFQSLVRYKCVFVKEFSSRLLFIFIYLFIYLIFSVCVLVHVYDFFAAFLRLLERGTITVTAGGKVGLSGCGGARREP